MIYSRSIALGFASVGRREGSRTLRLREFLPRQTRGKNDLIALRALRKLCEAFDKNTDGTAFGCAVCLLGMEKKKKEKDGEVSKGKEDCLRYEAS